MEITQKDPSTDLSKSHTHFFRPNIVAETDLAFRIKVINRKGALTTVWIPKSRCCCEVLLVNSSTNETRTKYYAPNFFIK